MNVYKTSSPEKYWLHCQETNKIININATGARKVATVCAMEIINKSTVEVNRLRGK